MLTRTGPNGLATRWEYDAFGRQEKETRADATETTLTRAVCSTATCPARGALKVITRTDGAPAQVLVSDILGREVLRAEVSFARAVVATGTGYNARGQVEMASRPYVTGVLTDYRYDPFGNLIKTVVDAAATGKRVRTTHSYDTRGRKTATTDPDLGSWTYQYNALGEVLRQTDAKAQVTTFTYDALGRRTQRVDDATDTANARTSTWVYDTTGARAAGVTARSIGKPVQVAGGEGDTVTYRYDSYGRPDTSTTWLDEDNDGVRDTGEVYSISRTYDTAGRVDTLTYPVSPHHATGLGVSHRYTADGYLKALRRSDDNSLYWQAGAYNAAGQLTRARLGNGVTTRRAFDADTGLIAGIQSHTTLAGPDVYDIQDQGYEFDSVGNLTGRTRRAWSNGVNDATYTEAFTYDTRNRLTGSSFNDGTTVPTTHNYGYDALGNLSSKTGKADYTYGSASASCTAAGPHAVTAVGDRCFAYDANGNQTAGYNFTKARTRTLTWTAYNKPRTIQEGALTLTFDYGADRARIKQVNNATLTTTTYVGNLYEKQVRGNTATHVHYLRAGGQTVALYRAQGRTSTSNPVGTPTSANTRYLHRDHLGSITVITNENQGIVERLAYDAWGKRRAPTAAQTLGRLTSLTTLRGFSGHEMLDTVSLIHMNGRVYDPDLGRFLSADPTVQFPGYSQSYNRYSYVLNNPLSYTDPSGFGILGFFKGIGKLVKGVARFIGKVVRFLATNRIVQSLRTIAAGIACGPPCAAAAAGAHTALNGGGIGDIFKSMAITFASAQAFGELHQMEYGVGKIVAHGVVGGIANELRGGSFLAGFLSAGVTQALSPGINMILPNNTAELGILTRTGAAAVVGGVGSVLGGGKFRDGAITGAFSRLFNDERENLKDVWNQRAQSRTITIRRPTGEISDSELIDASDWKTLSVDAGPVSAGRSLLRWLFGRLPGISYTQGRTARYGQRETVETSRYRTVYDLVNGRITNEQIYYESETLISRDEVILDHTVREVYETRQCVLTACVSQ